MGGKTDLKGKMATLQILKSFLQKLTELLIKVFYKEIVIEIKYSEGCDLLAGLSEEYCM